KKYLRKLTHRLGIGKETLFLGNIPLKEIGQWYTHAQVTVLPSFFEGFGRSIVESYLFQTPVIATPFVSAKELIKNEETGFILSSFDNEKELAQRLLFLLEFPNVATKMGKEGEKYVRNYILPEEIYLGKLLEIWESTKKCGC
ncbi:MAG TPA: glycosyltransferase, partial [bacterium]|nr:glycosyltransferase [bacterium]HEX67915.1 glycosyltransferase [bacterium]